MPLLRDGMGAAPTWCELRAFEIIRLAPGETRQLPRRGAQERLIVAAGSCQVVAGGAVITATAGLKCELADPAASFALRDVREPVTAVWLCGDWGEETGGWGLFSVQEVTEPVERGDPVTYPKRTNIDNHYHDCDEYWTGSALLPGDASGRLALIS